MTRAPERPPAGYVECSSGCGRWKPASHTLCWSCVFDGRPEPIARHGHDTPDWTQPPIQPPEPETWRGMRVGQRYMVPESIERRILAAEQGSVTTTAIRGGIANDDDVTWYRNEPSDVAHVESWTLVSDAGEVPRAYDKEWNEGDEPAAVPAKVEPAKVCQGVLGCKGSPTRRIAKGFVGQADAQAGMRDWCDACYLLQEQILATLTPHTEPKEEKSRPPRYPESNDIDQDIADSWER